MSPGPTFDRVYMALKEQLTSGRFPPGEHLEPAMLGDELNASITPVRDALHRLVGERIIEAPRNDGFRVPSPTEAEIRGLYGWNRELLDLALRRAKANVSAQAAAPRLGDITPSALEAAGVLFRAIAGFSPSPEHQAAVESLNDRLGPLRVSEEHLFDDWRDELDHIRESVAGDDLRPLRRAIAVYHRRRQRHVPELLVLWRRLATGGLTNNRRISPE